MNCWALLRLLRQIYWKPRGRFYALINFNYLVGWSDGSTQIKEASRRLIWFSVFSEVSLNDYDKD